MRVVVAFFAVCLLFVFPAFAIPITFDFSLAPDSYQSDSGLNLNVEASSVGRTYAEIDWSKNFGFGVLAAPSASGAKDSGLLDGSSSDDVLTFNFDSEIQLAEIVFSWVNYYDLFELWVEEEKVVDGLINASGDQISLFNFSTFHVLTSSFSVRASDANASFRIKSISVDFTPSSIPEPSTWLLFAGGALGLFFFRKRSG